MKCNAPHQMCIRDRDRRRQTHLLAEDNDKKAESLKDYTYSDPISGATKIDSGIVAMINLQMRNNQWQMARLNPRYYGDKQIVETKNSSDDEIKKSLTEIRDKLSEKSKREY